MTLYDLLKMKMYDFYKKNVRLLKKNKIWPLELKAVPLSSSMKMTKKLLHSVTAA